MHRCAHLEDVLLWGEGEFAPRDGEGDVRHGGDLVAVHHRLAAGQEGQRVACPLQLVLDLLLRLLTGHRHLLGTRCCSHTCNA